MFLDFKLLSRTNFLYFSLTVSENIPVRRSRRLAHMDVDGNKLSTPEGSDNEEDGKKVR